MNWKVATFKITDDQFRKFTRYLPAPNDCVINLLEFLNLVDQRDAGIMRIFVGKKGVDPIDLLAIFDFLYSSNQWRFQDYTSFDGMIAVVDQIQHGHVGFCGVKWKNGGGHVMMMGRTLDNRVWLIDPQMELICSVRDKCFMDYFDNVEVFYSLQYK